MNRIELDDPRDFLVWRQGSGNTIEIFDLQVGSERRQGHGRRLVNNLLSLLPEGTGLVWAITRASNFIAQQFYEEMGFRVIGVLRSFYKDQGYPDLVDAIMYGKDVV